MYRRKGNMVDAEQWFPDPDFGSFEGLKYKNKKIGYDKHNVEYTVWDVGIQTERGFIHLKPGDWIIIGDVFPCRSEDFKKCMNVLYKKGSA